MRRFLAVVLLLAPFTLPSTAKIPLDEFALRRASLRKSLDGVIVLFGQTEGRDEVFRVRQSQIFITSPAGPSPERGCCCPPPRRSRSCRTTTFPFTTFTGNPPP